VLPTVSSKVIPIPTMSLLPSSSAVSERLIVVRQERALARAAFLAAVEAASVQWEAELLVALEEFRDAGGFVGIQDHLRSSIRRERLFAAAKDSNTVPLDVPSHWSFLHHEFDVKTGLLTVTEQTVCVRSGEPTMATERADLRIRILAAVKKELREAILADLEAQEVRDRALIEERDRATREEQEARQRLLLLGADHRLHRIPRGVVTLHPPSVGF